MIPSKLGLLGLVGLVVGLGGGCQPLDAIGVGVCGNSVIEQGEDCDGFPAASCGRPGTAQACRLLCDPDGVEPELRCPVGWGCGADGICRQASGGLTRLGEAVLPDGSRILRADIDGDRADELLTLSPDVLQVLSPDAQGELVPSYIGDRGSHAVPVVARLTQARSRRDDVAFLSRALVVGTGQPTGELWSAVHSSFTIDFVTVKQVLFGECRMPRKGEDGDDSVHGVGQELIVMVPFGAMTAVLCASASPAVRQIWYVERELLDAGASQVVAAQVAQSADCPCDELVAARPGQSVVRIMPLCVLDGDRPDWPDELEPIAEVSIAPSTLDAGDDPRSRVFVLADLNLDGHLDLLVRAREEVPNACPPGATDPPSPQSTRIRAAYGLGTGAFHSMPEELGAVAAGELAADGRAAPYCVRIDLEAGARPLPDPSDDLPLAVADLTGDGRADFVYPSGLVLSLEGGDVKPGGYFAERVSPVDADFAHAGDFHGNGHADVLLSSRQTRTLTFLQGAGNGEVVRSLIPLVGSPEQLAVGDFDGDGLLDVAVAQRGLFALETPTGDAEWAQADQLGVSFGRATGPPEPPLTVGRLERIEAIASGNLSVDEWLDGADDLALVTTSTDPVRAGIALVLGGGGRMLISPYIFSTGLLESQGGPARLESPVAVASGRGFGDRKVGLAVLTGGNAGASGGTDGAPGGSLWWLPLGSGAQITSAAATRHRSDATLFWSNSALLAMLDLDGDGTDEIVILAPSIDWNAGNPPAKGSTGKLLVIRVPETTADDWSGGELIEVPDEHYARYTDLDAPRRNEPPRESQIAVADLDGDGRPDLMALALTADGGSRIVAYLNDGSGSLALERRLVLYDSNAGGTLGTPIDFALLEADGEPGLEIVVVTDSGIYLADLEVDPLTSPPSGSLGAPRELPWDRSLVARPRFVARADLDGDGVDDLAIAGRDGELVLLRGVPRRP